MKKAVALSLAVVMACVSLMAAAVTEVQVYVNGAPLATDFPAVQVEDSTTMVPLRAIFNALGVTDDQIVWDNDSNSLEVRTADHYIFLAIGSKGGLVDGVFTPLLVAPYLSESDRTMIPLRFVSESLGAAVEWDEQTKTVTIVQS